MRKEEEFMTELRRLREEHCELMQQLYPGRQLNTSSFDFDEFSSSDGSCSPVEATSLRSASCPSLELPSTATSSSPNVAFQYFDTSANTDAVINNDVMLGQTPDGSLKNHYESDDDNSSVHIDDIDFPNVPSSCKYYCFGIVKLNNMLTRSLTRYISHDPNSQ